MSFMEQINATKSKAIFFSIVLAMVLSLIIMSFLYTTRCVFNLIKQNEKFLSILLFLKQINKHIYVYILLFTIIIIICDKR